MTTLNTIIEEEKKKFDQKFSASIQWIELHCNNEIINGVDMCNLDKELKDFLATAMQRAYEAGEASAQSDIKALEASYMALKDDYSEICRALGFKGDAWFGDPLESHQTIVARAEELHQLKKELLGKAE